MASAYGYWNVYNVSMYMHVRIYVTPHILSINLVEFALMHLHSININENSVKIYIYISFLFLYILFGMISVKNLIN